MSFRSGEEPSRIESEVRKHIPGNALARSFGITNWGRGGSVASSRLNSTAIQLGIGSAGSSCRASKYCNLETRRLPPIGCFRRHSEGGDSVLNRLEECSFSFRHIAEWLGSPLRGGTFQPGLDYRANRGRFGDFSRSGRAGRDWGTCINCGQEVPVSKVDGEWFRDSHPRRIEVRPAVEVLPRLRRRERFPKNALPNLRPLGDSPDKHSK